jgi:Rrf2 family protein
MLDLALHEGAGPVPRRTIVARQGFSSAYVAHLFRRLQAAGLVKGVKGPGGGYVLARPTASISAGDVVRAVEGPIAVVRCVAPGGEQLCTRTEECVTRTLWQRLSATVAGFLDAITLQDLCDEVQEAAAREAVREAAQPFHQKEDREDGANL